MTTDNYTNGEVRRELREQNEIHKSSLRPFSNVLDRFFGSDSAEVSTDDKAALLGIPTPNRRSFLRIGGITIAGAALLAACGDDKDDDNAMATSSTAMTTTTAMGGAAALDLVLLRTATSVELLAVDVYKTAIASGLVTTPAVGEAATLFMAHHGDHAAALSAATTKAGGEAYDKPNEVVNETVVKPALAKLTDEASVVALALMLEQSANETYAFAASKLSLPAYRQAIMTIGGVEARHAALLSIVLKKTLAEQFPASFIDGSKNPLGDEALIK